MMENETRERQIIPSKPTGTRMLAKMLLAWPIEDAELLHNCTGNLLHGKRSPACLHTHPPCPTTASSAAALFSSACVDAISPIGLDVMQRCVGEMRAADGELGGFEILLSWAELPTACFSLGLIYR